MKYLIDTHTHTIASGHAYNTIDEMTRKAAQIGLPAIAFTEHTPKMPGSCGKLYFSNFKVLPREKLACAVCLACEANIMDYNGNLDMEERLMKRMDVVIASLHLPCMKPGSRAENTEAYLNVMKNPYVNIIGHPDDGRYEIDYPALVQGAREYGKVLELNNHSLEPSCFRQGAKENDTEMLKLCMKYQVPVVMSSDAHFDSAINEFESARSLLEELNFPEELVLNRSADALKPFVNRKF